MAHRVLNLPEGFSLALAAKDDDATRFTIEEGKRYYRELTRLFPNMVVSGASVFLPGHKPAFVISMGVKRNGVIDGAFYPVILQTPYEE